MLVDILNLEASMGEDALAKVAKILKRSDEELPGEQPKVNLNIENFSDFPREEDQTTTSHDKFSSKRYSEGNGKDSSGKHSGKTFKDRVLQNPALIGAFASALLVFFISVIGIEAVQAENMVNLLLYLLVNLIERGYTLSYGNPSSTAYAKSYKKVQEEINHIFCLYRLYSYYGR